MRSGEAPAPMTPAEADLRRLQSFLLDVARLRDSDCAALKDPEAFRCAVLSWAASWHQLPAGSLPSDEFHLARLCGYGRDIRTFRRAWAAGGSRGWILCTDGRLYHKVVAEKVTAMWGWLQKQRARTASATAARHPRTHASEAIEIIKEDGSVTDSATVIVTENASETVTSTNIKEKKRKESMAPANSGEGGHKAPLAGLADGEEFSEFWVAYPRKVAKAAARKAWAVAIRNAHPHAIIAGLRAYKFSDDMRFVPHPTTWLKGARWEDESLSASVTQPARTQAGAPPCPGHGHIWSPTEQKWFAAADMFEVST